MLKTENIVVSNTMQWKSAVLGARNAMDSWDRSDTDWASVDDTIKLGPNDLDLACRLIKAGSEHRKFLRMIHVQMDITAPLYWVAEHDTYKVGTTRNSCSFMHKGVSKSFEINDFSVSDERIYYLLNDIRKEQHQIEYPYETEEYKYYTCENGRKYKIFKNGRIFACEFEYTDSYGSGRNRKFQEKEISPSLTKHGYYEINIGGRNGERWLLHRLLAHVWIPNEYCLDTVNHINGHKYQNNIENLEWCSRQENIQKGFKDGLYNPNKIHLAYKSWKAGHCVDPLIKTQIKQLYKNGEISRKEIQEKYGLSICTINNLLYLQPCENQELFEMSYLWEQILDGLNKLRDEYLETKDTTIFSSIRQLLPQGYNVRYTWDCSMETILNILHQRKGHKLNEWEVFRQAMFDNVPYCKEFYEAMYGKENNNA